MDSRELIGLAAQLAAGGVSMKQAGRHQDAVALLQQAYAATMAASSNMPVAVELLPPSALPGLAHSMHFVVRINRRSLRAQFRDDAMDLGMTYVHRLGMVGALCCVAARELPEGRESECIVDISDGWDLGGYVRLAFSSASPAAILIPDPHFFDSYGYDALRKDVATQALPWRERLDAVFWRGSLTGRAASLPQPGEPLDFECLPRLALCAKAKALAGTGRVDIGLTALDQIEREDLRQQIEAAGVMQPQVPKAAFLNYRYQVDIDGNTNSWGLLEKMIMGATILKVASRQGWRQWYYDRLEPWVHFVPVAADLSDFEERVDWVFDHPGEAEAIGANAAGLAEDLSFERVMLEAQARFSLGLALGNTALA